LFVLMITVEEEDASSDDGEESECNQSAGRDSNRAHMSIGGCRRALVHVYIHAVVSAAAQRQRLARDGRVGRLAHQRPSTTSRRSATLSTTRADARRRRPLCHPDRPCTPSACTV